MVARGGLSGPPPDQSLPGHRPATGEGRMRHFSSSRTQRSGVDGKALRAGVPPRHPTRSRRVRGCLRGQAGPGQQRSLCRSRRPPDPPAVPQHGGAGAKAGGGTTGWADMGAGGSNTEGRLHRGCSPPAPLRQPDTSPRAASVQASVRAGWRCRWHVPGTPRQWRLAVVAQVAVPCPVP